MGASAASVQEALGSLFTVKALQVLNQLHVLQQYWAADVSSLRLRLIADCSAIILRQADGLA